MALRSVKQERTIMNKNKKSLADQLAVALDELMQSEGGESRDDADSKRVWSNAIKALNLWRTHKED